MTWAGHASWIVRIGGLTVLTDPVWSRRILGTPARITPVGVRWEALPPVDAVLISHNHYDHLDAPTLHAAPQGHPAPRPHAASAAGAGAAASPASPNWTGGNRPSWAASASTSCPRTTGPSARSWTPAGPCGAAGCSVTRGDGGSTSCGDTGYGHWFKEIGRRYPGLDLAMLPIGAYEPRWWLSDVHTDPEEAVQAYEDLGARAMAPMHWATFLLSAEPVLEPLTRLRTAWQRAGHPRADLWDLPVGASRVLEA